jgi:hypothetical protein
MDLFRDLKNPIWIHLKGWLFLLLTGIACVGLFIQNPTWQTGLLLSIGLWSACRCYYYMFYVIEKYVDPDFKFAGLTSVVKFLVKRNPAK